MRKGSPPVRVAPLQQNIGSRGPTYLTPYESGLRGRKFQVPIPKERYRSEQNRTEQKQGTDSFLRYRSCFAISNDVMLCYSGEFLLASETLFI